MTTLERPRISAHPQNVAGFRGVALAIRRELATKFATRAFLISTLVFAGVMFVSPLLMSDNGTDTTVVGHTDATATAMRTAEQVAPGLVESHAVASEREGRAALSDGEVDVLLVPKDGGGYRAVAEDEVDPAVHSVLSRVLVDESVARTAMNAGVSQQQLAAAARNGSVEVVAEESDFDISQAMIGLAFPLAAVIVVFLWAVPLATDVMQEKASRVVEILLTSLHPWQLLTGKILATTIIGLTQLVAVLIAAYAGMRTFAQAPDLSSAGVSTVLVGVACLVLAVMLASSLMAGLAARTERQEDLNSVLQPAFAVALVPLVAAVYGVFSFADSVWLDIASLTPGFNVYTLPARMGVESVPGWQIGLSLLIAVATTVAAFAFAGRIYSGSVLRSGGRVSFKESLRSH